MAARPKRPSFGTLGRRVNVKANHFRVTCGLQQASLYEVIIDYAKRKREAEQQQVASTSAPPPPAKLLPSEINRSARHRSNVVP